MGITQGIVSFAMLVVLGGWVQPNPDCRNDGPLLVPVPAGPACAAPVAPQIMPPPPPPPPLEPPSVSEPVDLPTPVVSLSVRVLASGATGQPLEYHIKVQNRSPAAAHHVLIKNPLPANARYLRASPEPHQLQPEILWKLGTIPGGGSCDITLVLLPLDEGDLNNCTRIQFEHGQCVTTRIARGQGMPGEPGVGPPKVGPPKIEEPGTKQPPGTEKDPPIKPPPPPPPGSDARLKLEINGPAQQYVNLPTKYLLTVKNVGTAPATNLLVTATLPDKLTYVSSNEGGKYLEGQVAWFLGTLKAGDSQIVEVVVRAKEGGRFCLKGGARADRDVNADAELCTLFQGASALLIEMVDRLDPIAVAGETSYPVIVTNQGQVPATNIQIRAFIPPNMELARAKAVVDHRPGQRTPDGWQLVTFDAYPSLAPGAKLEYEIFVRALRPGDVRFQVEMTADQLREGGPVREQESTTIYPDQDPDRPPGLQSRQRTVRR